MYCLLGEHLNEKLSVINCMLWLQPPSTPTLDPYLAEMSGAGQVFTKGCQGQIHLFPRY